MQSYAHWTFLPTILLHEQAATRWSHRTQGSWNYYQ